jgi:hypothetical protein
LAPQHAPALKLAQRFINAARERDHGAGATKLIGH